MTEINRDYLAGFAAYHQSEAIKGALPQSQNSPQRTPFGLYPEQLSGTAFTAPRHTNFYTWLYRIHPSVSTQKEWMPYPHARCLSPPFSSVQTPPTQMRWSAMSLPDKAVDFIDGLVTMAGHGSPQSLQGAAVHLYAINESMRQRYFYNADGDLLIVPQQGRLLLRTELGELCIEPEEIAVIQRGICFQVHVLDETAVGYVCENFGAPFKLPDLGPIGANGLAHPRHFLSPVAAFEEIDTRCEVLTKFQGCFWRSQRDHSPLNVVAWHGNYVPYKYDLRLFNTINTVSFDHPDPSIFTVLTSQTNSPGIANIDFVIFPPRWMVAEHTFRPPYYHRNIMSEWMGLIKGQYDAKPSGFVPGGASLHNCMSPHGPDAVALSQALKQACKPERYQDTLAFMFESLYVWQLTDFALDGPTRQKDYLACWQKIPKTFNKEDLR